MEHAFSEFRTNRNDSKRNADPIKILIHVACIAGLMITNAPRDGMFPERWLNETKPRAQSRMGITNTGL